MKKILIIAIGFICFQTSYSQMKLDRSKPPAAGPAPILSIGEPVENKLSNGMTILIVENHKLPKVTANYKVDFGPVIEGQKAGVMSLMGRMLNEGTTLHSKAAFDEAVDQMGSNVDLTESGGFVSSLTRYFDRSFMLMSEALLKPSFDKASFDKLKSQMITGLKSNEKNAKAISARVVNALTYGPHTAEGEFETEQTINALTVDDVRKFYSKYITPSRGFLTFVGDITPAKAKELAEKAFGSWHGATISLMKPEDTSNPTKTEIDLVDVPNAVQSELSVINLVKLPMNNPDYFPVLLANNILGGGSDSRLFKNLREKHGFTYGSYSSISAGRYQTAFHATASVRNEKADSAVMEILSEINSIRNQKVSDEELKNAKALYDGNFALSLEDPARTASFASNIIINNLPKDFYKTYLQKINAVTAEDVQRVAQKYFNYANTRIVVVGKAAVVQAPLSKLNYPLNIYDKFANATSAVASVVEVPKSTSTLSNKSTKDIIDTYLKAIGGVTELKKVNSVLSTGDMTVQGMSLAVTKKEMSPNLQLMEMNMNGQAVMKQVYDGKAGYRMQMGNKQNLSNDEISEFKNAKGLFTQLFYNDGTYKLENAGTEKVSGKDAYKLMVTDASGNKSIEYYDVVSGLLVKSDKTVKAQGQEIQQSIEFSNYKKVGNIMFPFTNSLNVQAAGGSQEIVIEIKDIKINEGISTSDFK